eukprot:443439-Amphidinium_carterae.1
MFTNPAAFFDDLLDWLAVPRFPQSFWDSRYRAHNTHTVKAWSHLTLEDRRKFYADPYVRDCKVRLEEFTGRKFNWTGAD